MDALSTVLPVGGIGATLAGVIYALLRANGADRREYHALLAKAEARTDAMAARLKVAETAADKARADMFKAQDELAAMRRHTP